MCLQYKCFENTVGKGEIARNEQFLLFPQCFLPIWRTFCHFHQVQNHSLQTLLAWKGLIFVILEKVNSLPNDKILVLSKLIAFSDDKINLTKKIKLVFVGVEIIVGKEENANDQHFLLFPPAFSSFPTMFSKAFNLRVV